MESTQNCNHENCWCNLGKKKIYKVILIVVGILLVCSFMRSCSHDEWNKENGNQINTISFSGHGEAKAVPDVANINFTIRKEAKVVKDAQDAVSKIEKNVLVSLKANGVADKDIKTESASFNPKYEYVYTNDAVCAGCVRPGKSIITGYEAYESISVKIRNIDTTGKIVSDLGALGVTELSGPNFTVDKEDLLKNQARTLAINDAKSKAKELSKELGVRLVKITSFSENGNYPMPMYAKSMMMDSVAGGAAPAQLPKGENTISSDVTITYQIR